MPAVSNTTAKNMVACLILVAVAVCGAGLHKKRAQRDASVDWHDVSLALMEVEKAKTNLHQTMQQRIVSEQQSVALRQQ